jgi:hypothetical protein
MRNEEMDLMMEPDSEEEELTLAFNVAGEELTPATRGERHTNDEKCAKILHDMTYRDKISFATLLKYIHKHRRERAVMEKFRQLKTFVPSMAISRSEWKTMFDEGLWTVAHTLLRREIMKVAELEEIGGKIDDQIQNKTFGHGDPVIPMDEIQLQAPQMIWLLEQITQPLEHRQRSSQASLLRITYLIANLCQLQQPRTCEAIPVALGLFLKANGLRRKGIDILNHWGICCSYNRLRKSQKSQMQRTRDEIRNMKLTPCLNITIDNCDIADGVNEERMGDHGIHTSATTGLVNQGIEMPDDGLTQDMLNLQYRVKTSDIINEGVSHKSLPKVFTLFPGLVNQGFPGLKFIN